VAITRSHPVIATALKTGPRQLICGDADTLGRYDATTGSFSLWYAGDLSVGEPTYIPEPGVADQHRGWWTTIATDRTDLTSRLLIIPAADPASGPLATVRLPQRVPAGLPGAWLPTEE